jgi:mannose-6-phosphate isomerase
LPELVAAHPEAELGSAVVRKFGRSLPFLLKLLAAEEPLSLQAHPNREQAVRGFSRDEAAGVPRDAPTRRYRDPNHKPELFCALRPSDALCGFRPLADTRRLLRALEVPALAPLVSALESADETVALRSALELVLGLGAAERAELLGGVRSALGRLHRSGGEFRHEMDWALRLGELYPEDAGVVVALLLNLVRLAPGEAIYLPAGNLHAYLRGVGVEIMASSDNVLRGGLTPKHVDVPELLSILDFRAIAAQPLRPERGAQGEQVYATPADEFRLSRLDLAPEIPFRARVHGPEILWCLAGPVSALRQGGPSLELGRGQAAFVCAATDSYELRGSGAVFRAAVGRVA